VKKCSKSLVGYLHKVKTCMLENVDSIRTGRLSVSCPNTDTRDMLNCIVLLIVTHFSVH
jgi:hypothetical protein